MNPLYTPIFEERVNYLNRTQYWSKEKLNQLQIKKLRYLIDYVCKNIPFYKDYLNNNSLTYDDFNEIDDLRKLPLIDKKILQSNYDKFLPINGNKEKYYHRTTGGSTGTPLTVYSDLDFLSRDKANTEYYMNVFGLNIFEYKSIRIYGDKINPEKIERGIYWERREDRKLVMSCYNINKETATLYVDKINEFQPLYIHTRPSSIFTLANYIISQNLNIKNPIRFIFCDGEYITSGQRRIIERAFQGRLLNIYGHTEGALVGHPCFFSDTLHFMPQVGILELLDRNAQKVKEMGQKGELVATGFNNYVFPLIRYRTGDIGIYGDQSCPCGRNYTMISSIEGRVQDYIVNQDSQLVPLAPAIFNYNDMDWKGIKEFKVIQKRKGELTIQVVPEGSDFNNEQHKLYLSKRLSSILGNGFSISIEFVKQLEKSSIGKYRYLEQNLNLKPYFRGMNTP